MSIYFKKALGAGLFGGEGFIMQKFEGEGVLFVELDGSTVEYDLQAGEQLVLDTGHLSQLWTALAVWIFKPLRVLKTFSSAAKDFSTQL